MSSNRKETVRFNFKLAININIYILLNFLDVYTEEVLDAHDREVTRIRQYFEANKAMLENVGRWQKLFQEYLQFEVMWSN